LPIVLFLAFANSCANEVRENTISKFDQCAIGEICKLNGRLSVFVGTHGRVGVLDIRGDCIAVSLPAHVYDKKSKWEGKVVSVVGKVYSQAVGGGIISYELEDRMIAAGMCDKGKIVYVTEIKNI
jgi:hypothetical protein